MVFGIILWNKFNTTLDFRGRHFLTAMCTRWICCGKSKRERQDEFPQLPLWKLVNRFQFSESQQVERQTPWKRIIVHTLFRFRWNDKVHFDTNHSLASAKFITTRGINLSTTKFSVLQGTCGLNFVREKIQTCILTCVANSISET